MASMIDTSRFADPPRRRVRTKRGSSGPAEFRGRLQGVFDALLIAILAVTPLVLGGRYEGGKFVFVSLVVLTLCVWTIQTLCDRSMRWYGSHALWLVVAGILLLALQLVPRGEPVPLASTLLPTWSDTTPAGEWRQSTFLPAGTRGGIVMLLAYGGLFFLVVQRVRSVPDVEWMLRVVGWITVGLAAFGIIQYLTSNDLFWWFYQHPWRTPSGVVMGPFDNRNHFTNLLALGCGPLVWLWLRSANSTCASGRSRHSGSMRQRTASERATVAGIFALG
ncbi:MAG: hypothetical protein MI757_04915, partial [Pirellulales bacterium]|nr:hypothetical protein [Pirellulales bacterium]